MSWLGLLVGQLCDNTPVLISTNAVFCLPCALVVVCGETPRLRLALARQIGAAR